MDSLKRISLAGAPSIIAACIVWVGFLTCLFGANRAIRDAWEGTGTATELQTRKLPTLAVPNTPATAEDYRKVARALLPLEGVVVKPSESGIAIEAEKLVDYESWRLVVDEIMLSNTALRWKVKRLCAGDCPRVSFSVTLEAVNQAVVIN